jgi:hypothetical protein
VTSSKLRKGLCIGGILSLVVIIVVVVVLTTGGGPPRQTYFYEDHWGEGNVWSEENPAYIL